MSRWCCTDDLKNYFKRSDYFGDLNEAERNQILYNLGILSSQSEGGQIEPTEISYNELVTKIKASTLVTGARYIITDFYAGKLLVIANSTNLLDTRAILLDRPDYFIQYDVNTNKIIYMRDSNGNSAYYDFKNTKFTWNDKEYYTFSYIDNGEIKDASELSTVHDNHLAEGCTENIFIGDTYYNTFDADCKGNIFESGCNNCHFIWETVNNDFKERVVNLSGNISNKTIDTGDYVMGSIITKTIHNTQNNEYVISYLDQITYVHQIIII